MWTVSIHESSASSDPRVTRVTYRPPALSVYGERFLLELDNGAVYVRHPRWSLVGSGSTLQEALLDLYAEARDALELLTDLPLDRLSAEAVSCRAFLLRFA